MSNLIGIFLLGLLVVLFAGAMLLVPGRVGSAIITEREEDTLDLLAMTFAGPWQVIAAKMVTSFGFVLLIVCALAYSLFLRRNLSTE